MSDANYRKVGRTGLKVTQFGLGGTGLGSLYRPVNNHDAEATLSQAWKDGIRFFDTAPMYGYGQSERRIGDFLREKSGDDYVLSTKVGRLLEPGSRDLDTDPFKSPFNFTARFDYSYDATKRSLEDSLQRLGLPCVDIVLIHDIGTDTHGPEMQPNVYRSAMDGAYRALHDLRSVGVIKAIGLGVNEWHVCLDAMRDGDFDCFLLAGRYTLLEQSALDVFLPKCIETGASVFLGGVFNSGILVDPAVPNATFNYKPASEKLRSKALSIQAVCKEHGVSLPAASLALPLRHPAVASILSGASRPSEIEQITAWLHQKIPESLWDDLKAAGLLDGLA
ncbi:aldo/keto reductase [Bradyrhizobium sp. CB3481]|uniref:aldo/keto reductase n=1 Tax=Bradyrhizobium sp. CB3481 TaxID=3039158 RepID=UPI0024B0F779|nr:aldo/keto reductase [Bradyrhizobium sp. CB3481]WFU14592.1 aldo/keto reductase [Bradyrhizobium sp. CB3481]